MGFKFFNPWRGGALGILADAIVVIQNAISAITSGHRIKVSGDPAKGLTISYVGTEPFGDGWSGKIIDPATGAAVVDVDVTKPANLQGTYICYDTDTGSNEWADSPKNVEGWLSYHVCDALSADAAAQYGAYSLSSACSGDIVLPGAGIDIPTTDKFDVMTVVDDDDTPPDDPPPDLKWAGKPFAVKVDPDPGFEFVKPIGEEYHTQMKAKGTSGDVPFADGSGGAAWAKPLDVTASASTSGSWGLEYRQDGTPPTLKATMPNFPLVKVLTDVVITLSLSGGTLQLEYDKTFKTLDIVNGTWGDETTEPGIEQNIPVGGCPVC